jgi:membrane associated rhomboid family serine protease
MIIPIGTQSSLALKPKLTIGIIAANIVVALITMPLMLRTGNELLMVQRERFAKQIRLYIIEHPRDGLLASVPSAGVDESIQELETAKDVRSFQFALYRTLQITGVPPEVFREYENALRSKGGMNDTDSEMGFSGMLAEWNALRAKEQRIADGNVLNRLGLIPNDMNRGYTFFTHLFVHGGVWHLLGNMLFLWIVGCLLEDSWGRIPFLVFYLAGGAFAGLTHCLQDTSSTMPLVGASGAIAAAMGAFTIRHFWTRIRFFYFFLVLFKPYVGTFCLPAFVFLPLWFIAQLVLRSLDGYMGGVSTVAYMAHIAGFSAGLIAALAMRITGFEERFLAPAVMKTQVKAGVLKDPRFERACELLERGNHESARALFNKLIDDRPQDFDTLQDIALLYREKGFTDDYAAFGEKALRLMILKGSMEEAARYARELVGGGNGIRINAPYLMRVAKWLTERESYGEAYDIYRSIIASSREPNILSKAYIALTKLLSEKMNNILDARRLLEEARTMRLDTDWQETISKMEAILANPEEHLCAPDNS